MHHAGDDGTVDRRHWLPPGDDVVTPERAAKGDLSLTKAPRPRKPKPGEAAQQITHAEPTDDTVLGHLVERGTLLDHHRYYGMVFLDLKRYFLRQSGHRSNPMYALEFFSTSSTGVLERVYLLACRRLSASREKLILHALTTPASRVSPAQLGWDRERYQDAFETLVAAIDDARKQAREEEERGAL